jgi:hypothetical protein
MRSLFGFLVFIAVLVGLVGSFVAPAVVAPMVVTAVRAASPFGEQPLDVHADVDPLGLVRGFVGEIRISGKDLIEHEVRIGTLDVVARGVGIGDHQFAAVSGGLDGVTLTLPTGQPLVIGRIELSGASDAVVAVAKLDYDAAVAFINWSFDDAGLAIGDVELIDGGVSAQIFDQRVELDVAVVDDALVIPDILGAGQMDLLVPQPDDSWRLTGVSVSPDGMELQALVDVSELIAADELD